MVCFLRRILDRDSKYHAIPAGLVASVAFVAFSNNTVALYVMWKVLQVTKKKEKTSFIVGFEHIMSFEF